MRAGLILFAILLLIVALVGLYFVLFHDPERSTEPRDQDDDELIADKEDDVDEDDRTTTDTDETDPRRGDEEEDTTENGDDEEEDTSTDDQRPEETPLARIAGTVVDEHGREAAEAHVFLTQSLERGLVDRDLNQRWHDFEWTWRVATVRARSDEQGAFEMVWPFDDDEEAYLIAGVRGFAQAGYVTVSAADAAEGRVRVEVRRGVTLGVTVRNAEGEPLEGAEVAAMRTSRSIPAEAEEDPRLVIQSFSSRSAQRRFERRTTNERGFVLLGGFEEAETYFQVIADAEDYAPRARVNVPPDAQGHTEVTITLDHGLSFSGVVVDQFGEGVPQAHVWIAPRSNNPMEHHLYYGSANADMDGNFEVRGLLPARDGQDYDVQASALGYEEATQRARHGEQLHIELRRRGMIIAEVYDPEGNRLGPDDGASLGVDGFDQWYSPTVEWVPLDEQGNVLDEPGGTPDPRYERPGSTLPAMSYSGHRGGGEMSLAAPVEFDGSHEQEPEEQWPYWHARIIGLDAGEWAVYATHRRYPATRHEPVELTDAELVREIVLRFEEGSSLTGIVRDAEGEPVARARMVVLRRTDSGEYKRAEDSPFTDNSDADGRYTVHALEEGPSVVFAKSSESRLFRHDINIEAGLNELDIELHEGLQVTGRILYDDGTPAEDASLSVHRVYDEREEPALAVLSTTGIGATHPSVEQNVENEPGRFVLYGLDEATYRINVHSTKGEPAEYDVEAGSEDIIVRLQRRARIFGTVTLPDGTHPAEGELRIHEGRSTNFRTLREADRGQLQYDPSTGEYVYYLNAGSYRVELTVPGFGSAEAEFSLRRGEAQRVDLQLGAAHSVVVRVVDVNGMPVANAEVHVAPGGMGGRAWSSGRADASGMTDSSGTVELDGIDTANVVVTAHAEGFALGRTEANLDESTEVVVRLSAGGRIEGEVFNDEGEPEAGSMVMIMDAITFDPPVEPVATDEHGQFAIEHVPAGSYMISVMRDDMMDDAEFRPITVREGETTFVRFGGEPKVLVQGRVTRNGEPLQTDEFGLFGQDAGTMMQSIELDGQGRFEIRLSPGRYVALSGYMGDDNHFSVPFRVPRGVTSYRVELRVPTGEIRGVLRDASGQPVRGAMILATGRSESGSEHSMLDRIDMLEPRHATTTDEQGHFTLHNMAPRHYRVWAVVEGRRGIVDGEPQPTAAAFVHVTDGSTAHVELTLEDSGVLELIFDGHERSALAQGLVLLQDEDGHGIPGIAAAFADGGIDGDRISVSSLAAGRYSVFVEVPGYAVSRHLVRIRSGEITSLTLTAEPGGLLKLRVTDTAGQSVIPDHHRLLDESGNDLTPTGGVMGLWLGSGGEDTPEGKVLEIKDLRPGRYTLELSHDDGQQSATLEVTITAGQTTEAQVRLR